MTHLDLLQATFDRMLMAQHTLNDTGDIDSPDLDRAMVFLKEATYLVEYRLKEELKKRQEVTA